MVGDIVCAGKETHVLTQLVLQRCDIEAELAAPEIGAIPIERSLLCGKPRRKRDLRILERHRMTRSETFWNDLEPEEIIEAQIQQCPVHVEQHRVDLAPGIRTCCCGAVLCDVLHRYENARAGALGAAV